MSDLDYLLFLNVTYSHMILEIQYYYSSDCWNGKKAKSYVAFRSGVETG